MRNNRTINLSEFCYSLGFLIVQKMNVFWNERNLEKEDLANEIGYSTLGIVLSIENTKLHNIINKKEFFSDANFIEDLVEKILDEYSLVNQIMSKYLRHPGNNEKYENKSVTNFQLMSYFASLWTIKYEVDITSMRIIVNERYRTNYNKVQRNFILYYLNDILINKWAGTGDKSLSDIYMHKSNRYLNVLDKKSLEQKMLDWHQETLLKQSINFDNTSKTIFTIYSSFYSQELMSPNYEFEHIVSRKKLRDHYRSNEIPAGSLGNIMFLDLNYNRSKQDLSLYDSLKDGQILDPNFIKVAEYPSKGTINNIESDILEGKFESVKNMIDSRAKSVINNLINKLG